MPNSTNYIELVKRIKQLKKHLFPKTFSPTGTYSDIELDRVKGFCLLTHAEIEAFLEEVTRQKVISKFRDWRSSQFPSSVIITVLAAYHTGWGLDEDGNDVLYSGVSQISKLQPKNDVNEIIQAAVTQFSAKIEANNGIKKINIQRLIIPLGIKLSELDPLWVTEMDNFGKTRGDMAHQSVKTHQPLDPKTVHQDVTKLLTGLDQLDQKILALN